MSAVSETKATEPAIKLAATAKPIVVPTVADIDAELEMIALRVKQLKLMRRVALMGEQA